MECTTQSAMYDLCYRTRTANGSNEGISGEREKNKYLGSNKINAADRYSSADFFVYTKVNVISIYAYSA